MEAERDSLSSELCGRELRLHDQVKRIAQLQVLGAGVWWMHKHKHTPRAYTHTHMHTHYFHS